MVPLLEQRKFHAIIKLNHPLSYKDRKKTIVYCIVILRKSAKFSFTNAPFRTLFLRYSLAVRVF